VKDAEIFTSRVSGCCLELFIGGDSYENPRENRVEEVCFLSQIGPLFPKLILWNKLPPRLIFDWKPLWAQFTEFCAQTGCNNHCHCLNWFHNRALVTVLITYLLAYLHTCSMEQSPYWESNRFSDSQEIARILWKPKDRYSFHKCPPPVPILCQLESVHAPASLFL